jgi:transcriptional regulator with XRE-family HTH domain
MKDQSEQTAFYQELGANIRERRKALELSQEALARLVGLTRTSLTNIENGRQHPPLHTFCEIIQHLKVDVADLLPRRAAGGEANGIDLQAMAAQKARSPGELAFITGALGGRKQETADGDTKKKDRSTDTGTAQRERGPTSTGAGHQDRQGKGRPDRR